MGGLDAIDASIVDALRVDARATNRQLARTTGLAESTVHGRVRRLEERGIIAGYEAVVRQERLGRGLQALIGVVLRPGARQASITDFSDRMQALPEVSQLFFLGGTDDFILHVAVEDSSALRHFVVDHLSASATVASTRTSIVFAYSRTVATASFA